MEVVRTSLEGVVAIRPRLFEDIRGEFFESFSHAKFAKQVCEVNFVQDNESKSHYGVVRGLHYQLPPFAQSKLVRVVRGVVVDVVVDMRRGSPTFGKHVAIELSAENRLQLFVPRGFAHGFAALADDTIVQYKCDNPYSPQSEKGVAFDDPELGIDWRVERDKMVLSSKDCAHPLFKEAEYFEFHDNLSGR